MSAGVSDHPDRHLEPGSLDQVALERGAIAGRHSPKVAHARDTRVQGGPQPLRDLERLNRPVSGQARDQGAPGGHAQVRVAMEAKVISGSRNSW